jgi:hypothetical protein
MVRPLTRVGINRPSWIGLVALGGIMGVILTGCSGSVLAPGSVAGTDALPPALQLWAAFPVTASPRPLVIAPGAGGSPDGPHGVYGDANVKEALLGGAFDRPAHLPAAPATVGGYPIISADKAFDLLDPHPGAIAGIRLTLTEARLGTASFGTDRGARTLPAWLFSFARVDGPIPVLAVAPAARWFPSALAGRNGDPSSAGAVVGPDHRTLTISFIGGQSSTGPCGMRYEVTVTESRTAVMVTRMSYHSNSYTNDPTMACPLIGFLRTASAVLKTPLGARVLVDDQGFPMGARGSP